MNILETVLNAGGGTIIPQIAKTLGVGEDQTKSAMGQLLPALARGLSKNASRQEGLSALLGALGRGNHQRFLDNPNLLGASESLQEGNGILGHIFGSKDVSRQVAGRAAEKSGLGADLVKKMLPMVATLAMGALGKKAAGSGLLGSHASAQATSGLGGLASFLDFDKDGSIADDVLGIVSKQFFGAK